MNCIDGRGRSNAKHFKFFAHSKTVPPVFFDLICYIISKVRVWWGASAP
jgi:hypothetical protein